ncbi:hypothetical protein [Streptomyces sp. NPDC018031]|uniref:hypothetical protein n=1 Tax=Streptomyces sp. NPDC018031 TaxID=3365033 RepID=UPI00378D3331
MGAAVLGLQQVGRQAGDPAQEPTGVVVDPVHSDRLIAGVQQGQADPYAVARQDFDGV